MTSLGSRLLAAALSLTGFVCAVHAHADISIFDGKTIAEVHRDDSGAGKTFELASTMLAADLHDLSGQMPVVVAKPAACRSTCILLGLASAPKIRKLAAQAGVKVDDLSGQWEVYRRFVVHEGKATYIVIAGSDVRGTIYGVVDLTRSLGVSPWSWWADVSPRHQPRLTVSEDLFTSTTPSVKYRGIFLNDEDWGLEPWAAKTLDASKGNIGPKTYARVFELMWRLKANTLWPAMHAVSAPFYSDPASPALAHNYAIVIGTSHAEPMMRNNLREWDETRRGPFDFTRNRDEIARYWSERIQQSQPYENIYTVGLRGIHDGPMQGADTTQARRQVLEDVIGLQQRLLTKSLKQPVASIPQVYVAYHELQEAYDAGLSVPDDVTLMWTDDNYGYLRHLSGPVEQKRAGGAGIYYHLSYWGRPHDYLWLGTTHPGLIREEMGRAFDANVRQMWIVNVGDIKPIEYLTEYFLDLAFDANRFHQPADDHLQVFMSEQFGPDYAAPLTALMRRYYDLSFERKPEFMGFGQTEWVTPNRPTRYVTSGDQEALNRIGAYRDITAQAEAIAAKLPEDRQAAFYELVLYPVRASAELNIRILSLDLAEFYAREQRASANSYVDQAKAAHTALVEDTKRYNALLNGKWQGMMDMAPRRLPVFDEPVWPQWSTSQNSGCDLSLSGQWINDHNTLTFVSGRAQTRPVTLFAHQPATSDWSIENQSPGGGLTLSREAGVLDASHNYEAKLTLRYDGLAPPADRDIVLRCGGAEHHLYVRILPPLPSSLTSEDNKRLTLGPDVADLGRDWETVSGLGSFGSVLRSRLTLSSVPVQEAIQRTPLTYRFATSSASGGKVKIVALPTHPATPIQGLGGMVSLDDGPMQPLDFSTTGRSDQWRDNVLANSSIQGFNFKTLPAGEHILRLYPADPGLTIDRIEIDLDGAQPHYGAVRTDPSGP
ncbi:glycosyl hydrolase 115 family protein [Asticcacaulis sp. 201]|uniref:glycosyl hydrolase 115 family protein n=1 Tax=Asticcacaulis sp. 201 TaxID=3028787 RepID=UPI002916ACB4|nr:glycosyl hydrolase 115 family protein [Asticcacaulis sp. 201]MDV6330906.1 glycosyl hydrolase 115 family protein [Asticcacaulis sp. 201]